MEKITLIINGRQVACSVKNLSKQIKELLPDATSPTANLKRIKQALKEGRSGRINSADGYQIVYTS